MITAYRNNVIPSKLYACHAVGTDKDGNVVVYDRNSYWSKPVEAWYEEHTPNSEGSRNAWKSYEHYRRTIIPGNVMGCPIGRYIGPGTDHCLAMGVNHDPWFGYTVQRYGAPGLLNGGLPLVTVGPLYVKRTDGGFIPAPSNIDELRAMSLRTLLPLIKSELSLVNSIIELKDFLTLKRSLNDITRDIQTVRSVYSTVKLSARATLSRMFKANRARVRMGSNAYLQHAFNLSPLVADINGIFRSLSDYEKKMNDLLTRAGSVQTRHFRYVWGEHLFFYNDTKGLNAFADVSLKDEGLSNYVTRYQTLRRDVATDSAVFHAQVKYNYLFTDYQVRHAKLLTLLDYFGVNLNPAIIWNAIPWSFVVDWVFGVGRYLDQFKEGAMQPKINILGYLWSIKRHRRTAVRATITAPTVFHTDGLGKADILLPMVDETAYRRQVETIGTSSITSSGLSLKEVSLGAALVLARRRRTRRVR